MENDAIATADLVAIRPSGERVPVRLRVGTPMPAEDGGWTCTVSLGGLFHTPPPLHGEDSLQALCLALAVAASLLRALVASGGAIEDEEGGVFPLEAYFGWLGGLEGPA